MFPNPESCLRLIPALVMELVDDWQSLSQCQPVT
uniref:Uncharacterized protein n=1 Tax=Desulfatirhabdium butyrativorans TaxID=340467 RepID=A0A7C4W1A3_9BACT